jgi:hypothetical protein
MLLLLFYVVLVLLQQDLLEVVRQQGEGAVGVVHRAAVLAVGAVAAQVLQLHRQRDGLWVQVAAAVTAINCDHTICIVARVHAMVVTVATAF